MADGMTKNVLDQIEPAAASLWNNSATTQEAAAAVSIAISLKRIADALTPRDANVDALNIREILSELLDNTRGAP